MVTAGGNRQATDIDVKVFTNGNSLTNIRALQQWIKDNGLTRDRLISITANETDIEDGDNVITIFYRKKQIKADSIPLDNIAYEAFNNTQPWDRQLNAVNSYQKEGRPVNVISVSRTAKNVGDARCQSLWYTMDQGNVDTVSQVIPGGQGNWDAL